MRTIAARSHIELAPASGLEPATVRTGPRRDRGVSANRQPQTRKRLSLKSDSPNAGAVDRPDCRNARLGEAQRSSRRVINRATTGSRKRSRVRHVRAAAGIRSKRHSARGGGRVSPQGGRLDLGPSRSLVQRSAAQSRRAFLFPQGSAAAQSERWRLFGVVNSVPGGGESRRLSPPRGWVGRCLGSALV